VRGKRDGKQNNVRIIARISMENKMKVSYFCFPDTGNIVAVEKFIVADVTLYILFDK
jgi:hypothetical protein